MVSTVRSHVQLNIITDMNKAEDTFCCGLYHRLKSISLPHVGLLPKTVP